MTASSWEQQKGGGYFFEHVVLGSCDSMLHMSNPLKGLEVLPQIKGIVDFKLEIKVEIKKKVVTL